MNFLVMPIFFLSGALFPLTDLPRLLEWRHRRSAVVWNGWATAGVDWRGAFWRDDGFGGVVDGDSGAAVCGRLLVFENSALKQWPRYLLAVFTVFCFRVVYTASTNMSVVQGPEVAPKRSS